MPKDKVLWFCNSPVKQDATKKSSGGWLKELSEGLKDQYDLTIVFQGSKYEKFRIEGVNYISLATKNHRKSLLFKSFFNTYTSTVEPDEYLKVIKEVNPSMIHIHGTEKNYIEIFQYDEIKVPILVSIQGVVSYIAEKYFGSNENQEIKKKTKEKGFSVKNFVNKKFSYFYKDFKKNSLAEFHNLKRAKFIAGRTDWDHNVTRVLAPESKYYKINRILKDNFYHHTWEENFKNQGEISIHTTTSDHTFKGLDLILKSYILLTNIGIKVKWNVAGVSKKSPFLKYLLKKFNLKKGDLTINFLGKVSPDEIISSMKESNVYVMTSYAENSPNNLAEAMILGMPCIATDVGGTSTYLQHNTNGILVQEGDALGMAGAIISLMKDRELALAYGKTARKDALNRHDKEKVINEALQTYRSIIK